MKMKITRIVIVLFFCLLFAEDLSKEQLKKIQEVTEDVNKAPNFSLQSMSDSVYVLENLKGKVVLINFWATWCGPCRMEIPDFNDLYDKYHERGLEILGISISDTKEQLSDFLKAYKVNYPVLYGRGTEMQKVLFDYGGVYSVPVSFLIDRENNIKRVYPGAILRKYDPNMYLDLVFNIESSLAKQDSLKNTDSKSKN